MKILVVGGTGILGSEICRRLSAQGHEVNAFARAHGGDIRSRASLEQACDGVNVVISTATAMGAKDKSLKLRDIDGAGQRSLVDVARSSGVEHFTFVSVSPALEPPHPLIVYKRAAEQAVRESGMRWTVLQPSVFMDVWLSPLIGWDFAARKAMIFGSGKEPIGYISVGDVAEYAVRSIEDTRLHNQTVPLAGPEFVAPNDVVRIFEDVFGQRFKVKRAPRPVLVVVAALMRVLHKEEQASMAGLGAAAAAGDVFDNALQRRIGLPLSTVREYAQKVHEVSS